MRPHRELTEQFVHDVYEIIHPRTNAELIRGLTDEELASYLVKIGWDCSQCSEHERLENESLLRGDECDMQCTKHCLGWLKQPREGENYARDFI